MVVVLRGRYMPVVTALTPLQHLKFWARVVRGTDAQCWTWFGALGSHGYGVFSLGKFNLQNAHRVAWRALRGPLPEGLSIDHLCRNRRCVNPSHMELVTNVENVMRGESFSAVNARKTHCQRGHLLAGDNLESMKNGARSCRICHNETHRIAVKKRRARKSGIGIICLW